MWQLLTPLKQQAKPKHFPARRPRWYRPDCMPLEDRCLLSVSLTPGGPPTPLVGSPVTWTATAGGHGTSPVYQFSVGTTGSATQVVQDFSPSNSFTWDPLQEGSFDIQVTVKDGFGDSTGESASATYTAQSRIVGTGAVINPTANPLVALYSAPPSAGGSMYVEFSRLGSNPSWTSTVPLPIVPGESTNFLIAGLLPNTTYLMRHVLDDGTASAPLAFTTGTLPTNLGLPTFTEPRAPTSGTDTTQNMVLHFGVLAPPGAVDLLATDLNGDVDWYYDDPTATGFAGEGVSLVPGGSVLVLGGHGDNMGNESTVKEINLAGDTLRETNVDAVNAQLATMGQHSILNFNHDAERLPNGDTAVIANTQRVIDVNGTPTTYVGNSVIVLDQNFQVAWVWDAFDWLDTNRLPTLGEGAADWLHGNSVAFSPADGNLIVSFRAQDWVVKIDYSNGTGDGHVVWRLGQGGDFTINSSDPSPWFSHQHDARYVNDLTLVLFDDGNTRRSTDPNADSRGQELLLNEQTMQATLVVNADLGNYSPALGSAQRLPNGNFAFTSGDQGPLSNAFGQLIEVLPNGTKTYVQQTSGLQYRSYLTNTLYGPSTNLVDPGFEDPSQGTGQSAYQDNPTGSAWTFSGSAGVAGNGSGFTSGNPNAPQGTQVAFLQKAGTVSQLVDFEATGSYLIGVSAAQEVNDGTSNQQVQVLVDGTVVGTFNLAGFSYLPYSTAALNLTAGNHTITFADVDPSGADTAALLDDVSIVNAPPTKFDDPGVVDLSSAFNRAGIVADGTTFGGIGLGGATAFSANLLGPTLTAGGATFDFGPAGTNANNVVSAAGQTIALPTGSAASLSFLATGVFGNQANQNFVVTYTDGTTATFTRSISDWYTPQGYAGESVALATAYRDLSNGGRDTRTFDVYQYSLSLDPNKQVKSITLPNDANVEVLAATLIPANTTQADLSSAFNRAGIVADGTPFGGVGLAGGTAYSANLLGPTLTAGGATFDFGPVGANANNVVSAAGQTIALPTGPAASLSFLATGVFGNQTNQNFVVTYTDGTTATFTRSISDWYTPQGYAGESVALATAYRDLSNGGRDARTFDVYQYSLSLDPNKQVKSITLPNDANVEVLAIDVDTTQADLSSAFNRAGIVADGTPFGGVGLAGGTAYSANLLGPTLTAGGATFDFGPAGTNANNVVSAAGQTIALPTGPAASLSFLATGVFGNQANQNFVVTYTDGTTATFTRSISDWYTPQGYAGESVALATAYRDLSNGGRDARTFDVYQYSLSLDPNKQVKSITLPNDTNVEVLAIDMLP